MATISEHLDKLSELVKEYKNTIHRLKKMEPVFVNNFWVYQEN